MAQFESRAMVALGSVTTNAGINVQDLETSQMWVTGTFVGTVKLQVSPDNVAWVDSGSPVTAPALIAIPEGVGYVRLNCTAYTSGSIVGIVTGFDEDLKG